MVLAALSAQPIQALAQGSSNVSVLSNPRYKANPVYLFFECYIQDVIGSLPPEKAASIQRMNLQNVFHTQSSEWHAVVRETLHLSNTIDIAILDLWYRNREQFKDQQGNYDSAWFSQVFTDEYVKEDSQVDVWPPGALEAAEARIKAARAKH